MQKFKVKILKARFNGPSSRTPLNVFDVVDLSLARAKRQAVSKIKDMGMDVYDSQIATDFSILVYIR